VCMVKTHKTARVQFGTTQQFVKSGQIRDARPKTGQIGVPGDGWSFTLSPTGSEIAIVYEFEAKLH